MATELQVPHVGESIYEVTIGEWLKGEGDYVQQDEPIVPLETDKASLDVMVKISEVETMDPENEDDRPKEPVMMKSVTIVLLKNRVLNIKKL